MSNWEKVADDDGDAFLRLLIMYQNLLDGIECDIKKSKESGKKRGHQNWAKVTSVAALFYKQAMEVDIVFRGDPWEMAYTGTLNAMLAAGIVGERTVKKILTDNQKLIESEYLALCKILNSEF